MFAILVLYAQVEIKFSYFFIFCFSCVIRHDPFQIIIRSFSNAAYFYGQKSSVTIPALDGVEMSVRLVPSPYSSCLLVMTTLRPISVTAIASTSL